MRSPRVVVEYRVDKRAERRKIRGSDSDNYTGDNCTSFVRRINMNSLINYVAIVEIKTERSI